MESATSTASLFCTAPAFASRFSSVIVLNVSEPPSSSNPTILSTTTPSTKHNTVGKTRIWEEQARIEEREKEGVKRKKLRLHGFLWSEYGQAEKIIWQLQCAHIYLCINPSLFYYDLYKDTETYKQTYKQTNNFAIQIGIRIDGRGIGDERNIQFAFGQNGQVDVQWGRTKFVLYMIDKKRGSRDDGGCTQDDWLLKSNETCQIPSSGVRLVFLLK